MKKYTKEELLKMDAVEVYKLVLQGKYIKKFPRGFWQQPEAMQNAIKCTKFLIEDMLKLTDDELKANLSQKLFYNNKLRGMLKACFEESIIKAIISVYPEKGFKPWEFNQVSPGYWNKERGIEATRWLITSKLKLTDDELKKQLSCDLFTNNGLTGMLRFCFEGKPVKAILESFPEKNFRPWEFNVTPVGYWNKETAIESVKWLIEKKLQLNDEQLKEQLGMKLFRDNGLLGMLNLCFEGSPYKAITETYPNKNFKPWEFNKVPMGYWSKEIAIESIKWLIEEKLQLNDEQLKEQLNFNLFKDNGLGGMLNLYFNDSPINAVIETYPEKDFKPWEFKTPVPNRYWNEDTAIESIHWLIETKLGLTEEELKEQLSVKLFKDNGLGGMLIQCFDGSIFKAIHTAYPNRFKDREFKNFKYYK